MRHQRNPCVITRSHVVLLAAPCAAFYTGAATHQGHGCLPRIPRVNALLYVAQLASVARNNDEESSSSRLHVFVNLGPSSSGWENYDF
jgi:hypothetical protein